MRRKIVLISLLLLILSSTLYLSANSHQESNDLPIIDANTFLQFEDDPVVPSNPTNVVIRESAQYDAPIDDQRPIVHYYGLVYWEELAGIGLNFFINTSDIIEVTFQDYESKKEFSIQDSCLGASGVISDCVQDLGDRFLIFPGQRSFEYFIKAYYDPDIVKDTGFIVIFNSQSVDFSIEVEGEIRFARVDYENRIVLPEGAGIVSQAPIDEGFKGLEKVGETRYGLSWEYINRQMDSKHDPLMIAVTYTYDEIFLAFTEQVYQNQIEQQRRQDQINKLNLINQSFVIVATFAIVASLFSILFAYLLARRKFEPKLDRAKELPRREVSDIEESPPLRIPVRSMFLMAMIIIPALLAPIPSTHAQVAEDDVVVWNGVYDLQADLHLTEYVTIELPVLKNVIYVYTNTSQAEFTIYDEYGNELPFDVEENRFVVKNPGYKFSYELYRPYELNNNSNMLVFLDRFWIEYVKPAEFQTPDDPYFNVDLEYTVILPPRAILYSASPSDLLEVGVTEDGRTKVTFRDYNRRMDAFHDVFETQVTFSFIGILDALENLNSDFYQVKAEKQDLESLLKVASTEVLLFSILGLIAPLISFLIAYWVFRRRYMKMIDRAEKEQEEKIFVESPQIQALAIATSKEANDMLYEAFVGHYYRFLDILSKLLGKNVEYMNDTQLIIELQKKNIQLDQNLLMEILSQGRSITPEDAISYSQLVEYAKLIDEMFEDLYS